MKEEEEELVYNYEGELLDEAIGLKGMHDAILKKMDTVFNKDQEGKKSSEIYPLIINTFCNVIITRFFAVDF